MRRHSFQGVIDHGSGYATVLEGDDDVARLCAEVLVDMQQRLEAEKQATGWTPPEAQGPNGPPPIYRNKPVNQGGKVVRIQPG